MNKKSTLFWIKHRESFIRLFISMNFVYQIFKLLTASCIGAFFIQLMFWMIGFIVIGMTIYYLDLHALNEYDEYIRKKKITS